MNATPAVVLAVAVIAALAGIISYRLIPPVARVRRKRAGPARGDGLDVTAPSAQAHTRAMNRLFSCPNPKCQAKYAIIGRAMKSTEAPACEECGQKFSEHGDWLTYQRADPIFLAEPQLEEIQIYAGQ